jgi:ABC-type phosphate transport system substrate-binding protein
VLMGLTSCGAGRASEVDATAGTARTRGVGGQLTTLALLGEAFKTTDPQAAFIVPRLGGDGVKARRAGAIDLAVISPRLKNTERLSDINAIEYARTPFLVASGLSTHAVALTTSVLIGIYNGETKTWPDGHMQRLVLRPQTFWCLPATA